MAFDPKDLEALAASLIEKGLPVLGGLIGGPAGAVAGNVISGVVGEIATSFGLAPDATPAVVAATVAADPQAGDKLAALEDKHKTDLALMQLQVDQNNAELTQPGPGFLRFFYGGWRPGAGWLLCPLPTLYQIVAFATHLTPLPDAFFAYALPVWVALAGVRTYERVSGVSLDTIAVRPRGK